MGIALDIPLPAVLWTGATSEPIPQSPEEDAVTLPVAEPALPTVLDPVRTNGYHAPVAAA